MLSLRFLWSLTDCVGMDASDVSLIYSSLIIFNEAKNVLDEQAVETLRKEFGDSVFSARQAVAIFSQTPGSTFVRLSRMTRLGLITRIEKGKYRIQEMSPKKSMLVTEWYRDSEIQKGGYATATYALKSAFMGHAPTTHIDFFVPARAFVELGKVSPSELEIIRPIPSLHPFASAKVGLSKSSDGILTVSSPARAFLDLLLIVDNGRRPVSLEYEMIPFLEELRTHWHEIISRSKSEGTFRLLAALIFYVRMISKDTAAEDFANRALPKLRTDRFPFAYSKVADLGGREKIDRVIEKILDRTGIFIQADRQEALSVIHNL